MGTLASRKTASKTASNDGLFAAANAAHAAAYAAISRSAGSKTAQGHSVTAGADDAFNGLTPFQRESQRLNNLKQSTVTRDEALKPAFDAANAAVVAAERAAEAAFDAAEKDGTNNAYSVYRAAMKTAADIYYAEVARINKEYPL